MHAPGGGALRPPTAANGRAPRHVAADLPPSVRTLREGAQAAAAAAQSLGDPVEDSSVGQQLAFFVRDFFANPEAVHAAFWARAAEGGHDEVRAGVRASRPCPRSRLA